MLLFVLFLLSLISLLLYFNSYIDQFAGVVRSNGIYISVIVFAGVLLYSWYAKKRAYTETVVDFFRGGRAMSGRVARQATKPTPPPVSNQPALKRR